MSESQKEEIEGPDLAKGISRAEFEDGEIKAGHFDGAAVVLVRTGDDFYAVEAECTHYGGPLQQGAVDAGTIRCPWHHAAFDLETGLASGPALESLGCYEVEVEDGRVRVTGKRTTHPETEADLDNAPRRVGIIGAGTAGAACAETLRKIGFEGDIVMLTRGTTVPIDRPNLSKDYLAGDAPMSWLPLRPESYYKEHDIDLINDQVIRLNTEDLEVTTQTGHTYAFDRILIATGAEPRRLEIPGSNLSHVHTLRTLEDADKIIERTKRADRVVVIGASFIGLEVTASLRERDLEVRVVDPLDVPMQHVFGEELGGFIQTAHEENGVEFHLGREPTTIAEDSVTLDDATVLEADFVVVGIGVEPRVHLAERAGLDIDDGIVVDEKLETSIEHIYAAGDVARFPYKNGQVRIEHFSVAERQGQSVARSMLGADEQFDDIPFFWTRQYGTSIGYVGHASSWDEVEVVGSLEDGDAIVAFIKDDSIRAIATINRPDASLLAEIAMERNDQERLREVLS